MCRNIHTLYNIDPPATEVEVWEAALQYVRKVSGYRTPSVANEAAFKRAVDEITASTATLLGSLETHAPARSREEIAAKRRAAAERRFGSRR